LWEQHPAHPRSEDELLLQTGRGQGVLKAQLRMPLLVYNLNYTLAHKNLLLRCEPETPYPRHTGFYKENQQPR